MILVTGAAGFIGYHVCRALAQTGQATLGIDNLNHYYDVQLKHDRLQQLHSFPSFQFEQMDLADSDRIAKLFAEKKLTHVIHLGAQAGVRYSIENPKAYIDSNIYGTLNILEGCRRFPVQHLVYASSSSVYGLNAKTPFSVSDPTNHPVSLYAATKKSNELMAHTYSHLYNIPTTGLRFFTVYGPWGRPDMAPMKFTQAILSGRAIDVYNYGNMQRDFTYIDDVVCAILKILKIPAKPNLNWDATNPHPGYSSASYRLYNIGNHQPAGLLDFIALLEKTLGIKAKMNLLPMQPGDVVTTFAEMDDLRRDFNYQPATDLGQGIQLFVDWYKNYYGISQ